MLKALCVAVLTAVVTLPLGLWLRRLRRAWRSAATTRVGASLPPTWQPPEPRPVKVLDATRSGGSSDWSRYARPAYQRRAAKVVAVTPLTSGKEDIPC